MIKYLGSKRVLIPNILGLAAKLPEVNTVMDLFSGTSRVGHAFKKAGYSVTANDHMTYAYKIAQCYIEADKNKVHNEARRLLDELARLPGKAGYITDTFCLEAKFFQPENGERIDSIRERIAELSLDPILEAILLVSLMEAADRVDSTCGLQMAYLKNWAPRSKNKLELRMPDLLPGSGKALQLDAAEAAASGLYDLVYIDPPYNQHKYLGNYHIWESLVRWDKPEFYGKAKKRVDVRSYKSGFNSKRHIADAFKATVDKVQAKYMMVSFSNEGHLKHEDIVKILSNYGETAWLDVNYRRYVGAQIGIYNPRGDKVGKVGNLWNKEFIFLVGNNATSIVEDYCKESPNED
jgi:adenine-specific DNA-methyltransferase